MMDDGEGTEEEAGRKMMSLCHFYLLLPRREGGAQTSAGHLEHPTSITPTPPLDSKK